MKASTWFAVYRLTLLICALTCQIALTLAPAARPGRGAVERLIAEDNPHQRSFPPMGRWDRTDGW